MTRGRWKTSSYSHPNGDCVEARCGSDASGPMVQVRDSKNRDGGTITLPFSAWTALVAEAKHS